MVLASARLRGIHPPDNIQNGGRPGHRVKTYRDVTSVPTFFVRMLGKLLDACI